MRRFTGVAPFSLDLHVLSAPLTFVLSQDQTLQLNPVCSGPAKEPAALTSQAGSPKRAARENVTCGSRRDLPKQTGAPVSPVRGRAHVTFVTYAYNPVFKDRAGLTCSESSFSIRLPASEAALCSAALRLQGAETYASVLLPSTSFLAFVTGVYCALRC